MQNDKELLNLIKQAYPTEPRKEFVVDTSIKLKLAARKMNNRKRFTLFSAILASVAICTFALSFFFIFNKNQTPSNYTQERHTPLVATTQQKEPSVYIYHTHNYESFTTNKKTKDYSNASDDKYNITLVGKRLNSALNRKGVSSLHDRTDVMKKLQEKDLSFTDAYKISKEPFKKALEKYKSIQMAFDIHRDSRNYNETTIQLKGKDYAKMSFVISRLNVNYEINLKFAQELHNRLEKEYPQLSRGVFINDTGNTRNTYNQELLGQSVLIEIGGPENTFKEEYRSADALAKTIKDMIVEREK